MALLEIDQAEPMLQLCVLRPSGGGRLRDFLRIFQTSCLKVTENQLTVDLNILWGDLQRFLEVLDGAGGITGIQSALALANQLRQRWTRRLG
jgi:hypothetical protein